jgi:hypothetical protein
MRQRAVVAIATSIIFAMNLGIAHSQLNNGLAKGAFICQIHLPVFPSIAITATTAECKGVAAGTMEGTGQGKDSVYKFGDIWSPLDKKDDGDGSFANMKAYHIVYQDVCQVGDIIPSFGFAQGDALVNATSTPNGQPGQLVTRFTYSRLFGAWNATLTQSEERNQNTAGQTPGGPVANGVGFGGAAGTMILKTSGFGTCAAPAPTDVIIKGTFWTTV